MITRHPVLQQRAGDLLPCLVAASLQQSHLSWERSFARSVGTIRGKVSNWQFHWREHDLDLLRLELEVPDSCVVHYQYQRARVSPRFVLVDNVNESLVDALHKLNVSKQVTWVTLVSPISTRHALVLTHHPLLVSDFEFRRDFEL